MTTHPKYLSIVLGACAALALALPLFANTTPGMPATVDQPAGGAPKDVCRTLIEAAQKGDFKTVQTWTFTGEGHQMAGQAAGMKHRAKPSKQGFDRMRKEHMEQLKNVKCGDEQLADDHAFVTAIGPAEKRLIPFVRDSGQWKFDARTYMSFYRDSMPGKR